MFYLLSVLWPYVLVAVATGIVIGWFGSERNES
jgi:hypothetical protein